MEPQDKAGKAGSHFWSLPDNNFACAWGSSPIICFAWISSCSTGFSFHFEPFPRTDSVSYNSAFFCLITLRFIQVLYLDLWGHKYFYRTVKIKALGQEQKITSLSAVLLVDSSEVIKGCSRSLDPGCVGEFFFLLLLPHSSAPRPDVFSIIYNPCLESALACINLTKYRHRLPEDRLFRGFIRNLNSQQRPDKWLLDGKTQMRRT